MQAHLPVEMFSDQIRKYFPTKSKANSVAAAWLFDFLLSWCCCVELGNQLLLQAAIVAKQTLQQAGRRQGKNDENKLCASHFLPGLQYKNNANRNQTGNESSPLLRNMSYNAKKSLSTSWARDPPQRFLFHWVSGRSVSTSGTYPAKSRAARRGTASSVPLWADRWSLWRKRAFPHRSLSCVGSPSLSRTR